MVQTIKMVKINKFIPINGLHSIKQFKFDLESIPMAATSRMSFIEEPSLEYNNMINKIFSEFFNREITSNLKLPRQGIASKDQIDIQVSSTVISGQTKKLKAKWSVEMEQDLTVLHGINTNSNVKVK